MYRCHYTYNGRIVGGENLDAIALDQAILEGKTHLAERVNAESIDGFEIWEGALLLHSIVLDP
jgi:hypothetical protein